MKPLDALLVLVSLLFATGLIVDHTWGPQRRAHRAVVRYQQRQLDVVADFLARYAERHGRYPTMDEGLDAVEGLREALLGPPFEASRAFLSRFPDVRTIHGVPYVYENREGKPREAFALSPAKEDRKSRRRFSRKVAPGVFVSSLGLRDDVRRVFGRAWLDAALIFGCGALAFGALFYVVLRNRRAGDRVRGLNAMILFGILTLLGVTAVVTRGGEGRDADRLPARIGAMRPDVVEEYLRILASFRDGGALDPATYERIERRLRADLGAR